MRIGAVVVLKHPLQDVWRVMRDDMERLLPLQDGIRELSVQRREPCGPDATRVVSVWQAVATVPALAAPYLDPDMFRWTDDAVWDEASRECRWRITPHHLAERIDCAGATRYEPALGGRGARVTMAGEFRWRLHGLVDLPRALEAGVTRGIEGYVSGLVPRNFRNVLEAARRYLETEHVK